MEHNEVQDVTAAEPLFSARRDRSRLTDWAYGELKQAILDLRLRPGEPLREAPLAAGLDVSKTPIREALGRLEQEGFVETTSFKGATVTGYSRRDLEEIYELRELLECAAARQSATSMAATDTAHLETLVTESKNASADGHITRLEELISEFDVILFEQLRNERIRTVLANLRDHMIRIGRLTSEIPDRLGKSVEEHARIVHAICARSPEAAEVSMRDHIRSVRDDQLRMMELAQPRSGELTAKG